MKGTGWAAQVQLKQQKKDQLAGKVNSPVKVAAVVKTIQKPAPAPIQKVVVITAFKEVLTVHQEITPPAIAVAVVPAVQLSSDMLAKSVQAVVARRDKSASKFSASRSGNTSGFQRTTLGTSATQVCEAIKNLTRQGEFDCIRDLKTFPKLSDIGTLICGTFDKAVIGGPTGSGKTVGIIVFLATILNFYIPSSFHTVYISIPLIKGVTEVYKYVTNKKLSKFSKRLVGYAAGGDVFYRDDQPVRIATTNHVFNWLVRMLNDPKERDSLNGTMVIIDEAHASTIENYLLLCLCLYIRGLGYALRIIIMSATLNSAPLTEEFAVSPKIELEGHMYNTQVIHSLETPYDEDGVIDLAVRTIKKYVDLQKNILVFVSGEKIINKLTNRLKLPTADVLPLFSKMPKEEIDLAFQPPEKGRTVVILSTNMAESSVTIEHIDVVISTGFEIKATASKSGRAVKYNEVRISKASAKQQRGRVGRVRPGIHEQLWSSAFELTMKENSESDFFSITPDMHVLKLESQSLPSKEITRLDELRHTSIITRLLDLGLLVRNGLNFKVTDIGLRTLDFQASLEMSVNLAHLSSVDDNNTKVVGLFIASFIEGCDGYFPFWVSGDKRALVAEHGYSSIDIFDAFKGEDDIETFFLLLFGDEGIFTASKWENYIDETDGAKKMASGYKNWAKQKSMNNKQIKNSFRLFRQFCNQMFDFEKGACHELECLQMLDRAIFLPGDSVIKTDVLNGVRRCLIKAFPGETYKPAYIGKRRDPGYMCGSEAYLMDKRRSFCDILDKDVRDLPTIFPLSISITNTGKRFISGLILDPDSNTGRQLMTMDEYLRSRNTSQPYTDDYSDDSF